MCGGGGGGGGLGGCHPHSVFRIFFPDDKTSAPGFFCSCSFIPLAHFEAILVVVSYYGFEI